jgi:hypothetical protein
MFTNAVTKRINELDAKVRQYEYQLELPQLSKYTVEAKFQELKNKVDHMLTRNKITQHDVKSGMFEYSFTKKLNQLNANVTQLEEAFKISDKPISYNVTEKLGELENRLKTFEDNLHLGRV